MKLSKTRTLIETLFLIATVLVLLVIPIFAAKANNYEDGDHFANMLAPLLSFIGSALVYIAFKAQIKANSQIQDQFIKQNYDQNFYRLVDNIQTRISNSEIQRTNSEKIEKGYTILQYIVSETVSKAEKSSILFGIQILIFNPEIIADEIWIKLYKEVKKKAYPDFTIFKNAFLLADEESRKLIYERDFDHEFYEYSQYKDLDIILSEIFMKYFYEQSDEYYLKYYNYITKPFLNKYYVFFDSYYRSISMILKHIDSIEDNKFYLEYFIDSLTTYELLLIWFAVASKRFSDESRQRIKKFNLLSTITTIKGIKIAPSNDYGKHIIQRLN
ncbi:hypothetical protein SLW70_12480 [Flavobacterium sp. NG2]|uniref:hypothetical protein n=1 Tax=Flavobacterium sp. NG2 TaxID=3097547 RepID=UPI002A81540D|nr:hypothetical protein [Flavobacterium sp. NG2]WPR70742.1 hypothetical protein SLW70_12480 [Flavobacterium sp. NG2]